MGLFLAKVVQKKNIELLSTNLYKGVKKNIDKYDDSNDETKSFLQPIRKIFNNDSLFDKSQIVIY